MQVAFVAVRGGGGRSGPSQARGSKNSGVAGGGGSGRLGRAASGRDAHHVHELLEVNLPVVVGVHLAHQVLGARPRPAVVKDVGYLAHGDLAVAVPVEKVEGREADVLVDGPGAVEAGGDKLRVVDDAAAVGVHGVDEPVQVRVGPMQARLLEALLELRQGQQAVAVGVEGREPLPEPLRLAVVELPGDDVQRGLPQSILALVAAPPLDEEVVDVEIRPLRRHVPDPLAAQRHVGGHALPRAHAHELAAQELGLVRGVLPLRLLEGQPAGSHLRHDLCVGGSVEGGSAAEQGVHDGPNAPEVAGSVVLALHHLRGDVERRPDLRRQDRALHRLPRRAEVDQLQEVAGKGPRALEQEVLGLEVPVDDLLLVHVEDGPEHVPDHMCGVAF
mmetsp:Transcript_14335/g.37999  ORF Transcript_14335/g.37999 Transcript_14335/m.37999 type:complete len:388 (+) Transcript_14335:281-1444(+)